VQKYGGEKALTKTIHDELKCHSPLEDAKVEVAPQIIDNTVMISAPHVMGKSQNKVKVRMVKAKVTAKKSRLERATSHLYDLEDNCRAEKTLNIDLDLYQMEDF
jgi:hypothetical protein